MHDLSAHLSGGIPNRDIDALSDYWKVFPTLKQSLFSPLRTGYAKPLVKANAVKNSILDHPEFKTFAVSSIARFNQWQSQVKLSEIKVGDQPKAIINNISEQLLTQYSDAPLLDKYDIYQLIMDYWAQTLQDDVYLITQDGWQAGKTLRVLSAKKGQKLKETPDLIIGKNKYKAELIPPALLVARYFSDEQKQIDILQASLDNTVQQLETYIEENTGSEDGVLVEALTDSGKISKASVTARLKLAKEREEIRALNQVKSLILQEANAKKAVKTAQEALDLQLLNRYPTLEVHEIKTLIVEDKWHATLHGNITAEIERVTQQLANRVKTLEERYAQPLPELTQNVSELATKVEQHLKAMGLSWQGE